MLEIFHTLLCVKNSETWPKSTSTLISVHIFSVIKWFYTPWIWSSFIPVASLEAFRPTWNSAAFPWKPLGMPLTSASVARTIRSHRSPCMGRCRDLFFHGFVSIVLHGFVYGYVCSIFYGFHWFQGFFNDCVCAFCMVLPCLSMFQPLVFMVLWCFVLILSIVSWCFMVSSLGVWRDRFFQINPWPGGPWKSMGWSQRPTEDSFSRNVLSLRSCSAKLW